MTGPGPRRPGPGPAVPGHAAPGQAAADQTAPGEPAPPAGWRRARPELAVAAVTVAAAAAAGYALAGPRALPVILVVAAAAALVALRWLLPPIQPPPPVDGGADTISTGWSSYRYWRSVSDLRDGIAARAAYEVRLRPALEHLLAARLAERHGINLYFDPAQARRLLCRPGRDDDLWAWIDPAQADPGPADGPAAGDTADSGPAPPPAGERPGIPRRTLERLINRLEQL